MKQGMIFSFEGIDASGKKTQSLLFQKWLTLQGIRNEYMSFPDYSTAIGHEISAFLSGSKNYSVEVRHMLYSVNRLENKDKIEGWLEEGKIVTINRYSDSNLAYGTASGLSIDWLRAIESKMPPADYVFYLKARPQVSKERKSTRDKFETDLDFLARVSEVYDELAKSPNWFTIEADNSVDLVQYEIVKLAGKLVEKVSFSALEKERPIRQSMYEGNGEEG
jgi:dTMP kinase